MTAASPPGDAPVPGDIDYLAALAYSRGTDPVVYAEAQVALVIGTHLTVATGRLSDPGAFPGYSRDLSVESLARRVLGQLLACGWTLPAVPGEPSPQEAP